jgi:catechol 2,3-dioxygenase-like lactoylglutathione lyase family enzyme
MSDRPYEVEGIDQIFIAPKDWEKSLQFWRDGLGLEVAHDWSTGDYHGATLHCGEARITLADPEPERDEEAGFPILQGRPYVYLKVKGLDAMVEDLRERGIEVISGPLDAHWGPRQATVRAPAGLYVLLLEYPEG